MGISSLQLPLFLLIFFNAIGCKKVCDLSDVECTTRAAVKNTGKLIKKYNLDPLMDDMIQGSISSFDYTLYNTTLSGLKRCEVKQLSFMESQSTFINIFLCPKLIISTFYSVNGMIDVDEIDQSGYYKSQTGREFISISGTYTIMKMNKMKYLILDTYMIGAVSKDNVTTLEHRLYKGDQQESEEVLQILNHGDEDVDGSLDNQIIKKMLIQFVEALKDFLNQTPVDEVLRKS